MSDEQTQPDQQSPPPLYQQWVAVTGALIMSYRVGAGVPFTRRQLAAYIASIVGPVQGNRGPQTDGGIPWKDVRKIAKRFASDLDAELKRLEREAGQ